MYWNFVQTRLVIYFKGKEKSFVVSGLLSLKNFFLIFLKSAGAGYRAGDAIKNFGSSSSQKRPGSNRLRLRNTGYRCNCTIILTNCTMYMYITVGWVNLYHKFEIEKYTVCGKLILPKKWKGIFKFFFGTTGLRICMDL